MLYKATTLTFTGLAVAFGAARRTVQHRRREPARGGRIRRGAASGSLLPAGTPVAARAAAVHRSRPALGGGVVGGVPGVLKARFGAHEVIVTIMLNFIVLALLNYLIAAQLQGPGDAAHAGDSTRGALPRLSDFVPAFHGSAANLGDPARAVVAALVVGWYLFRTRARLRAARGRDCSRTPRSTAA